MGQYKVPQDVEAEDHILGPLTFKQFIYAMIGVGWALVCYALFNKLVAVMILLGVPPLIFFLLLAFFKRDGQNFEQILVSTVGYWGNTRKRIWRKDEIIESYKIEPRKVVVEQTQRSPVEVRSELDKLATLLDSRGWSRPQEAEITNSSFAPESQERIILPDAAKEDLSTEVKASDDIYDINNSPLGQNLDAMMQQASQDVRREALEHMRQGAAAAAEAEATREATSPAEQTSSLAEQTSGRPAQSALPTPPPIYESPIMAPEPFEPTEQPAIPVLPAPLEAPPTPTPRVTNPQEIDILESSLVPEGEHVAADKVAQSPTPPADGVNILARGQKVVFRHGER